jgi:hypothetical protein
MLFAGVEKTTDYRFHGGHDLCASGVRDRPNHGRFSAETLFNLSTPTLRGTRYVILAFTDTLQYSHSVRVHRKLFQKKIKKMFYKCAEVNVTRGRPTAAVYIYIYIYIYVCVCVCVCCTGTFLFILFTRRTSVIKDVHTVSGSPCNGRRPIAAQSNLFTFSPIPIAART